MATLVLSTVGGIVGGPIGAAIGGLLGQAVDRDVLLRPAGRQGPRLTELSVQTSSYGTPLPRVFGTMRVAGSVIWSTDLIESHATSRSGKGQPSVTSYSYAASFAVAVSAREVAGVGRIWADGNLLRGAAGDWKSDVGAFRLHTGDEDQPPDPLIAAAEGPAPAHRGLAYAVFEQLQLADFGNRIPSLTFELVADAEPVRVGQIAEGLGAGLVDGTGAAMPLIGFSAYGDSIRATLETLADACGGWWAPLDAGVVLRCGGDPVATLGDEGVAADARGARRTRSMVAIEGVPRTVTVTHYDPARDYQAGLQRARRPGAGATDRRIELPAVLSAEAACGVAEATLARAEAARTTRTVALGPEAMGIAPGDVVALTGEAGSWRVTDAALEAMVVTLTLVPLAPASQVQAPSVAQASSGRVLAQVDLPIGRTLLVAAELPPLDGTTPDVPRVAVLATGTGAGWRRAALLLSTDDGAHWTEAGGTAAPATLGTVSLPPGPAPATIIDGAGTAEVTLARADMTLVGADDASLDAGANLSLVGDELVQFGQAEQIGPDRWRLSRLLRGRRGTEAAIGTARAGDGFALLESPSMTTIDVPAGRIGGTVRVMAIGVGETQDPAVATVAMTGASTCPPSPVALHVERIAGGVRIGWTRRSRAGWRWIDGTDAPLVEEAERYHVTIGGVDRIVTAPVLSLAGADVPSPGTVIAVRQQGINGESLPATITMPADQGTSS